MTKKFSKLLYLKALRTRPGPKAADLTLSEIGMLVLVFNYTGEDGTNAYPGMDRLAKDSGLDVRQVRRHLQSLRTKGFLREDFRGRHGPAGVNKASVYSVTLPESYRTHMAGLQDTYGKAIGHDDKGYRTLNGEPAGKLQDTLTPPSDPLPEPVASEPQSEPTYQTGAQRDLRSCRECDERIEGEPTIGDNGYSYCQNCCPF